MRSKTPTLYAPAAIVSVEIDARRGVTHSRPDEYRSSSVHGGLEVQIRSEQWNASRQHAHASESLFGCVGQCRCRITIGHHVIISAFFQAPIPNTLNTTNIYFYTS